MKSRRQILLITCLSAVVLMTAVLVISYRPRVTQSRIRRSLPNATQVRNKELLRQLGQAYSYMENGNMAAAEKNVLNILRERPHHTMAKQLQGEIYYRTERYEEAEKVYREILSNNDFDASAYNNLGQTLWRMGKNEEALKQLLRSRELNPNNMVVYINLSVVYAALNQHEKAREMFMAAHRQLLEKQRKTEPVQEMAR